MHSVLKKISLYLTIVILVTVLLFATLFFFQFDNHITKEDRKYAAIFLAMNKIDTLKPNAGFDEQLRFIRQVQNTIIEYPNAYIGIPLNHTRNLKDFYEFKTGLCYDNSHAIETILRVYGFSTRHISIYYYHRWFEKWYVYFDPSSKSHALSEVKTKKGWLLIDSLNKMIGVSDQGQQPLTLSEIKILLAEHTAPKEIEAQQTFQGKYVFVYGSYSRTGKLYPPFTFVPDYQLRELMYNLCPTL